MSEKDEVFLSIFNTVVAYLRRVGTFPEKDDSGTYTKGVHACHVGTILVVLSVRRRRRRREAISCCLGRVDNDEEAVTTSNLDLRPMLNGSDGWTNDEDRMAEIHARGL